MKTTLYQISGEATIDQESTADWYYCPFLDQCHSQRLLWKIWTSEYCYQRLEYLSEGDLKADVASLKEMSPHFGIEWSWLKCHGVYLSFSTFRLADATENLLALDSLMETWDMLSLGATSVSWGSPALHTPDNHWDTKERKMLVNHFGFESFCLIFISFLFWQQFLISFV